MKKKLFQKPGADLLDFELKKKSTGTGLFLELLVPGMGHYYAKDNLRGAIISVLGLAPAIALNIIGWNFDGESAGCYVLMIGSRLYGLIDMSFSIDRYNKKLAGELRSFTFNFRPQYTGKAIRCELVCSF